MGETSTTGAGPAGARLHPATARAWYALAILAAVTFCSLLGRLILVAEPIGRDLALTDLHVGLVQGFGVALFAALASFPLGGASSAAHDYLAYRVAGVFLTFAAIAFPTALQTISPPDLGGRLASIQFIALMLLVSAAAPVVGAVSDRLSGANGVLLAVTLVSVPALARVALLLRSCEGRALSDLLAAADASEGCSASARVMP